MFRPVVWALHPIGVLYFEQIEDGIYGDLIMVVVKTIFYLLKRDCTPMRHPAKASKTN